MTLTHGPTASRRFARRGAVALLTALAVLVPASAATAAGTGGIEVTPLPAIVDGKQATAFHVELPGRGSKDVKFLLRNVESDTREARVYVAGVTKLPDGQFDVGPAGSSPYASYDSRQVTLAKGEQRVETFRVSRPSGDRPDGTTYAALVVEVSNGAVVQRAATLIYLEEAPLLPLPLPVIVAIALVILMGLAVPLLARRRAPAAPAAADDELIDSQI